MTELIALLSTGKGSWSEVVQLMKARPWEKVFLVTNSFGKEKFAPDDKTELLVADVNSQRYYEDIYTTLKNKIKGFEVALNLSSGEGKEHMAVLSALMRLGVGFRLVTMKDGEFKDITDFVQVPSIGSTH